MKLLSHTYIKLFFLILLLSLFSIIGVESVSAQSTGISDAEVINKLDRDGDGYFSSFEVEISADAYINEKGNYYKPLQLRGEPAFSVFLIPQGGDDQLRMESRMYKTAEQEVWTQVNMSYDGKKLKDFIQNGGLDDLDVDTDYSPSQYMDVIEGRRSVTDLYVVFEETDGGDSRAKNDHVSSWKIELDKPIKLELPSQDRTKSIAISSEPSGATVEIDGKEIGNTTLNAEVAVDRLKRKGFMDISVYKDGYTYERERIRSLLPNSLEFDLKKEKDLLLVDSNKDDATVKVNGEEVGKTPYLGSYWVKGTHEVTVEKDGEVKEFKNVETPERVDAEFSNDSDNSNLNYNLFNDAIDYSILNSFATLDSMLHSEFSISSKNISTGENVVLDASKSYDLLSNIVEYQWSVDGSTVATQSNPVYNHTFNKPGTYNVGLTVVNDEGTQTSTAKSVSVTNVKPKATFFVASGKVKTDETTKLNASNSVDNDGSIVEYNWEMGDGSTYRRSGPTLNHTYKSDGEYQVELEVVDDSGASKTFTKNVKVHKPNAKPSPLFSVSNKSPDTGETVKLDASASSDSDGSISSYDWNLGNGVSKSGKTIQFEYNNPGTYEIELVVQDDANAIAKTTEKVAVSGQAINNNTQQNTNKQSTGSSNNSTNSNTSTNNTTCTLTTNKPYTHPKTNTVWRITPRGTKQPFQSSRVFKTWYDSFDPVVETTKSKIENCKDDKAGFVPLGPKAKEQGLMKGGTLIKVTSDPKVYLLLDDKRYWITSEKVFNELNYKWGWIQDGSMQLVNSFKKEGEINNTNQHKEGSLIKYPNSNKVYKLEKNNQGQMVKRHIKNEQVFDRLGYRFDRVVTIDKDETYPDGGVLR